MRNLILLLLAFLSFGCESMIERTPAQVNEVNDDYTVPGEGTPQIHDDLWTLWEQVRAENDEGKKAVLKADFTLLLDQRLNELGAEKTSAPVISAVLWDMRQKYLAEADEAKKAALKAEYDSLLDKLLQESR